ncbi:MULTISPECIES: hypothetical protein [unclassified Janthinobacterium]|uniref:hypothetical protein n=1 Tax=unclassified Janthinobacterium TaxID=2610881 RepID=UPI000884A3A1|nr:MULTISPECIES: hypothetical protein [unclassified Janthinobacterium]SDA44358.1 hypothetical protein SAMN03159349_00852 [Janthinobacterium sp. 551a]SFA93642.1 hypothetical protein SAMN03159300_101853 [Janthinobacterium sp. 344]
MQLNHAFVLTLIAGSLAACGGGGSSSPADPAVAVNPPVVPVTPPVVPVTPTLTGDSTGAVSARFANGDNSRFIFTSIGLQSNGKASTLVQDASGALSTIGSIVLTGNPSVTHEISGDASFAQGRWFKGAFSSSTGATTLTGNNASAHYVVYNVLAALPASGTFTCDAGTFTAPSYTGGGNVPSSANFGTASGNASIAFDGSGARIVLAIDASAGGSTGKVTASTSIASPASSSITGGYLSSGTGAQLMLGDGGTGRYLLLSAYKVQLANGGNYQGVATFRCS